MYLLEHDAKEILAAHGIPVPRGRLIEEDQTIHKSSLPPGPWIVKGQINAGGRGKAGIVKKADTLAEISQLASSMLGITVKGHAVGSIRIEQQVTDATEAYVALILDAAAGGVRVLMAAEGGVEVEALPPGALKSALASPDISGLHETVKKLAADIGGPRAAALEDAGKRLSKVFLDCEAMLVEVNPLFIRADGSWVAGDAKLVNDDNALPRQAALSAMLTRRASAYTEAALKMDHGFDYVVVDPDGEIGLLTTGAGLSMMLIDELRTMGLKPYNFLDVRTGGLRGEITRLVKVLEWIQRGPQIKVLLINIFAGITDLGEFSRLLVEALKAVPALRVPAVARLVGNGLPAARGVLTDAGITVYTELDEALAEVRIHLAQQS